MASRRRAGYRVERLDERLVYRYERFDADEDAASWLTRIEDRRGNAIVLIYDHGRLDHIVDTAGRRIQLRWARHGGQLRITDLQVVARGRTAMTVSYRYSQAGLLVAAVDACRNGEQYEYDERRRMTAASLKTGVTFRYEYDDDTNRCVRTWGPKGLYRVPLQYDLQHQRTYAGGEEPRIYHWDEFGCMTREATPSGIVLRERAFDADGYLIAEVDGDGEGTRYWYDELGNVTRVVDAADNETQIEYAYGRPSKRTTADGQQTHYQYDAAGDLIGLHLPSGASFAIHRDERGRVTAMDGPFGRMLAYEYDAEHNIAAEIDARGRRTVYQYDELGRPIRRSDPLDHQTRVQYDALGRRTAITYADGSQMRFSLDGMGNVIERTDRLGQLWKYRYAGMGVLTRVESPDGQVWKFNHTTFQRLKSVTNPHGEQYAFEHDEAGRVVAEIAFDGRAQRYDYTRAGRLGQIAYADGSLRSFRYDANQRLVEEIASDGSRVSYDRDKLGRLSRATLIDGRDQVTVGYRRDPLGRVVEESQDGQLVRHSWDVLGRRSSRSLPDGSATHYQYDADDALLSLTHALDGRFAHRLLFERDEAGRASTMRAATLYQAHNEMTERFVLHTRFDAMDRMLEQRAQPSSPAAGAQDLAAVLRQYRYDAAGRVTRIDDQRFGTTELRYDPSDRLLGFVRGSHHEAFRYDGAGYLEAALQQLRGGAAEERWQIGPGNQLLHGGDCRYEYDARGRRVAKLEITTSDEGEQTARITRYQWDVRDRMRAAELPDGSRLTFRYDAFGRRQRKDHFGAEGVPICSVNFLWDRDTLCADRLDGEDWRTFAHHPATQLPLLQAERGEVFTCVTNQVGVVTELIDDSGAVAWAGAHSAWGKLIEEQADERSSRRRDWRVASPFRLLGQYHDEETGLAYTRFRYFDADSARWCSPDPIGLAGGFDIAGFNGSPSTCVDKLGLSSNDAGSVIGALAVEQPQHFERFQCQQAAAAMQQRLEENGISGRRVRLETDADLIGSERHGRISETGVHEFVEVDGVVYDNMNPQGVPKDEYLADLGVLSPARFTVTEF